MANPLTRSDTSIPATTTEATLTAPSGAGFATGDRLPGMTLIDEKDATRAVSPDGVCQVLTYNQVGSVGTTATLLRAANANRINLNVRNLTADAYIGDSAVTAATGHLLKAGDAFDIKWAGAVYAITASGTTTFSYFEEGTA